MLTITKTWQHSNEPSRIHYIIEQEDKTTRHLYEDEGSALYEQLRTTT